MSVGSTWGYRIRSFVLALVVFIMMIELPTLLSAVVLDFVETVSIQWGGYEAYAAAFTYLSSNPNVFSAVVYLLFGIVVFAWVLVMRRRGSRIAEDAADARAVGEQAANAASAPAAQLGFASPAPEPPAQVSFRVRGVPRAVWFDAVLLALGMQFVTTLLMTLVLLLFPAAMEEYRSMIDASGVSEYGIAWFLATVVLPPIVEEMGFRGLGLTYLKRAGVPFAVANVLQAVAFGIFHMNLTQGIYTCVLGLFMGYAAHASGSIVPVMLLHAVYNFMGTMGQELLYAVAPWMPYWFEVGLGVVLVIVAVLSLRDRGVHYPRS
ncbi:MULTISPECIES: CPBP family intramembrane glutamic endopeptidase [Enorma]|uniref:CPBP family intramembrane glutamic endopeptidase n=1 Tax=Enorma TaxID=1472762 RepID=UPI00034CCE91|nr:MULTISPECIES: CPBP family intramembrane glutamic endopeptidase [Enorma]